MKNVLRATLMISWLSAALAGAQAAVEQAGPPPAPVRVAPVERLEMTQLSWVPGTVASRGDVRLAAEVPGRLETVAEVGDTVAAGAVVARIDDDALELQLKNDDATIQRLEANVDYLAKQLERQRALTEQQIAARNQLEEAESRHHMAEQELVAARVAREQTLFRLEKTRVTAPFAGRVVERLAQPGGYVGPGVEVLRLVDTRNVEVIARAPLAVAPYLSEGMEVVVKAGGREVDSRIRSLIPVGDERSRMFELRLEPAAEPWAIGTPVRVGLPSSEVREVTSVPRDALVLRSESIYVFRLTGEGTVERLVVETGIGSGERIEVKGALAPGDQVVVRGGERLRPGQNVTVLDG